MMIGKGSSLMVLIGTGTIFKKVRGEKTFLTGFG
jgi:hypothetical protein